MSRPAAVGFVLAFLLAATLGPVGVGTTAAATTSGSAASPITLQQDFDSTEFHITVYENGSARWAFRYKHEGLNESERQQFDEFARDFNSSDDPQLYRDFKRRANNLASTGSDATGRNMTATGFSKDARVGRLGNQGIVEMSFVWTNFAPREGDQVVVGDVFDGGLYVGPNQTLVVEHGPNLAFERSQPEPDSVSPSGDSMTWQGERSFADENPHVVLVPASQGGNDSLGGDSTEGDVGVLPVIALGFAILVGGVVAYAYRSGVFDDDGVATATGEASGPGASGAEPAISDEELLSDEDRVVDLLEEQGGRMKQVNIVEETGWSKSKVSMLLSDMEEEGHISKLRVGRENIVSLAGHEPDAAGSPFDDEDDE